MNSLSMLAIGLTCSFQMGIWWIADDDARLAFHLHSMAMLLYDHATLPDLQA